MGHEIEECDHDGPGAFGDGSEFRKFVSLAELTGADKRVVDDTRLADGMMMDMHVASVGETTITLTAEPPTRSTGGEILPKAFSSRTWMTIHNTGDLTGLGLGDVVTVTIEKTGRSV